MEPSLQSNDDAVRREAIDRSRGHVVPDRFSNGVRLRLGARLQKIVQYQRVESMPCQLTSDSGSVVRVVEGLKALHLPLRIAFLLQRERAQIAASGSELLRQVV